MVIITYCSLAKYRNSVLQTPLGTCNGPVLKTLLSLMWNFCFIEIVKAQDVDAEGMPFSASELGSGGGFFPYMASKRVLVILWWRKAAPLSSAPSREEENYWHRPLEQRKQNVGCNLRQQEFTNINAYMPCGGSDFSLATTHDQMYPRWRLCF